MEVVENEKSGIEEERIQTNPDTKVAGQEGFEPPTTGLRVPRSTWLSYWPMGLKFQFNILWGKALF